VRRVEGYVIVSADGMLADGKHRMPDSIRYDADQEFFQSSLDQAAAIVHGRNSYEGGPRADRRKRLVLTRRFGAIAPDPDYPNALFWNPQGATFEDALAALGATDGTIAIIGGSDVFTMFLPLYDSFHLSRAGRAHIPGGLSPFTESGTPEDVLRRHGLKPGPRRDLDAAADLSVTTWTR
jgi:dihydrofolate reductase